MTTSQSASGGGFQSLPQSVRDYYSKEVFWKAQPRLRFLQFAKVRRDLQASQGKSIIFVKYNNLAGGGAIAEKDTVVPQGMSASEVQITVTEQVNAIQVTEMLLRTSLLNTLEDASRQLANNFALVLDSQMRDTVLGTTNIVYGNGKASTSTMDTTSVFDTVAVKDAAELLATNNTPKIEGEYYVCFAHPHQLRKLRDDANWIDANKFYGRRQLYIGEAGMYEGVIFIDTTQMPELSSAEVVAKYGGAFSPAKGYEAVMFGDDTIGWAIALDVELRDDGVVDLGRKHTLGWYGIWGTGLLENDYAVRILTA